MRAGGASARSPVRRRPRLHRRRGHQHGPAQAIPRIDLDPSQVEFNTALGRIRAAVEHAIAHLKTWRMLSEEGGRYRYPS
ncbi:transposase family protein, partial [Pseudonocardia sp. ICBG601]|uniref:transposase family protein n=1 Tax=Pseudonocardia sp. ICBG601 TaxID=2846759 RepID=UPI0035ABF077